MGAYNAGTDYHLRNSVILDNRTNIYIINDQSKFIDELWLSNDFVYTGMGLNLIKGIETAAITIQTLLGPKRILLAKAVYILVFYINLAYLKKFNYKNIWWDNKKNLLYYKNDCKTFVYYKYHYSYLTLKYNCHGHL